MSRQYGANAGTERSKKGRADGLALVPCAEEGVRRAVTINRCAESQPHASADSGSYEGISEAMTMPFHPDAPNLLLLDHAGAESKSAVAHLLHYAFTRCSRLQRNPDFLARLKRLNGLPIGILGG